MMDSQHYEETYVQSEDAISNCNRLQMILGMIMLYVLETPLLTKILMK